MEDKWSTPKSSVPPHLRPSSRVTPTLALSEGPLSPSPIVRFKDTYNQDENPIFRRKLRSDYDDKENVEEPNVEIVKLQCQVEQLTQLVNERLSSDISSRSKSSTSQECTSHCITNVNGQISVHSDCQQTIHKLKNENSELQNVVKDAEQRFQNISQEKNEFEINHDNESMKWRAKISSLQQSLIEAESRRREFKRENEKIVKAKRTIESYLKDLPSVDEFQTQKNELEEKTESCRRMQIQIDKLNKKLINSLNSYEKSKQEGLTTKQNFENERLKVEELETENLAHQKRLSKSNTSGALDIEAILHQRDKLVKENNNLKQFILSTQKKTTKDIDEKNQSLQTLSEKAAQDEHYIDDLKESIACEKDTNKHLREQLTENIVRQNVLKKRIEILEEELLSSKNKNEISQDLEFLQVKANSEFLKCADEMRQLMYVSKQLVNGEEPNVSMLIGVHSSIPGVVTTSPISKSATSDDGIQELRIILKSIENIRKQVADLRETLSERYAESIAENVSNCSTQ